MYYIAGDKMINIRNYKKRDFDAVRFVCLNSDGAVIKKELQECILHTFCDYYIEREPENCFVLDDDSKAVGYIICSQDFNTFKKIFEEEYLPLNKPLGDRLYNWAKKSIVLHDKYKTEYPAHLHIDLLPQYQHKGYGGKMLLTLFEHLKEKNIKGVMLSTQSNNFNAISFYKKFGFTQLDSFDGDIAFGKKII